ncbi:DUF2207 domain-containing protein [Cyclonatronum proteinivorum]|nr:DUF2207 domain-containing protein [Cyclonatronum proteinivorum]
MMRNVLITGFHPVRTLFLMAGMLVLLMFFWENSLNAASQNQDSFERLEIEALVLTDGTLQITETRRYQINPFRPFFIADISHGNSSVNDLEVVLNGSVLAAFPEMPEFATNPAAEEPGPGFVLSEGPETTTISVFGRFGETELQLRYRLQNLVQDADGFAFFDHVFAHAAPVNMAEAQQRPNVRRLQTGFTLDFEEAPEEIPFARFLTASAGEPLVLQVLDEDGLRIRLHPMEISPIRPLHLQLLFSKGAVFGLPPEAAASDVTQESLDENYLMWSSRIQDERQRQETAAGKLVFWRPVGWILFFLCLYTFVARRIRKRRAKKEAESLDFNQPLTMADLRNLPVGVMKTLYSATVLQPRNRVLRLTGLALTDLARAGHLRMEISIPSNFLKDRAITSALGTSALRKMLPFEIKQLIENSTILIQPLEANENSTLRPWHKLLSAYINSRCKGKQLPLKELFPTRTGLANLKKSGSSNEERAKELRAGLKKLKAALRESYFEDLTAGLSHFKEDRNAVYIGLIAVLVAVYLMILGSFMGLFLIVFAAPTLLFAVLNRYDYTAEGLRFSRLIRSHINRLMKTNSPDQDTGKAEDLLADFMVLNWPRNYKELHSTPYHPLYQNVNTPKDAGLTALENIYFLNPEADQEADKLVHFTHFILQEVCHRSLMHYPDFVATNPGSLGKFISGFNRQKEGS